MRRDNTTRNILLLVGLSVAGLLVICGILAVGGLWLAGQAVTSTFNNLFNGMDVEALAYSPDGTQLVVSYSSGLLAKSADQDHVIEVLNLAQPQATPLALLGLKQSAYTLAFD